MREPLRAKAVEALGNRTARRVAGLVCALQALVLLGFCAFYVWEITSGASDDTVRAVMSVALIVLMAGILGLLGLRWLGSGVWVRTPTLVWNALLLPVAWSLVQADRAAVGLVVAAVAVVGLVAAVLAREPDQP